MKQFLFAGAIAILLLAAAACSTKAKSIAGPLKARLEIKAICSNYTFTLTGGKLDSTQISPSWTDESTGKTFSNAFGIANPCDFPASIQEGEEFYFMLDSSGKRDCAVCMAYYPTPPQKLYIKVIPAP